MPAMPVPATAHEKKRLRLHSTPQSTRAGEITVLAIIETALATAFSIWLVIHRETLMYVVAGACIAPLLLLKTDKSTALAYRWAPLLYTRAGRISSRILDSIETISTGPITKNPLKDLRDSILALFQLCWIMATAFLFWLICIPLLTVYLGVVRIFSILFTVLRNPLYSLRAIPSNWVHIVLAMDIHRPPELLPDIETLPAEFLEEKGILGWRFSSSIQEYRSALSPKESLLLRLYFLPLIVFDIAFFAFALAYRYSLKATAIVYLPLIWVLRDSTVDRQTLKHKLKDIAEAPIERLKRWYSWFVVWFLIAIPAMIYVVKNEWWKEISNSLQHAHPAVLVLLSAFMPTNGSGLNIQGWHLARGINAILTLYLFIWADGKLRSIKRNTLTGFDKPVAVLNTWLLIRGLLTLYVIGCTLYIIISAVTWKALWPVHIHWFPWNQ